MLLAVLSWGWIGAAAFLCGFAVLECIFTSKAKKERGLDLYVMTGLCALTVYAQFFSLFYKVGGASTGLLLIICLLIVCFLRKRLWEYFIRLMHGSKWYWPVFFLFLAFVILILTVQCTFHSDTDLYHAQSIRWIESLGVVKGLGNLHNRFAYNSAFFSLQALFSLEFLVNQSLHTMNGFIVFVMLCYAIGSLGIFKGERVKSSDLLKLCLVYYLCFFENRWQISSPGSDISALSMVLYISAKWCELSEKGSKDITEYGVLCLLAVWASALKLSASIIVLLAVYPAVCFLRERRWKQIALFLGGGVIILLPFLARNVIISGYLVYPFSAIDVFDVDWKMSAAMLRDDSMEITAWARGMTARENYDAPFSFWFPEWFRSLSVGYKVLFICNMACICYVLIYGIICFRRKKDTEKMQLLAVSTAGLIFWFVSAPLIRYGAVYLWVLPALLSGEFCARQKGTRLPQACAAVIVLAGVALLLKTTAFYGGIPWIRPVEYSYCDVNQEQLDGLIIYVPQSGDAAGYHFFPSTPYLWMLERIELRTGRLEDGFRLKEECRDLGQE
ncbi:MAG: hypothetical protein HFH05_14860 [Lachnospiraceae bacterium]|nr:hypothetical protein [Lachnospiraceae bacterium]